MNKWLKTKRDVINFIKDLIREENLDPSHKVDREYLVQQAHEKNISSFQGYELRKWIERY